MCRPAHFLLIATLAGCAQASAPAARGAGGANDSAPSVAGSTPGAAALTPEHFRGTATVKENAREATLTITTEKGLIPPGLPLRKLLSRSSFYFFSADSYLSGVVRNATPQHSYRVYTKFTYSNQQRGFLTVQFGTPFRTRPVHRIRWDGQCGPGGCHYQEHVAFDLTEAELRAAAAQGSSEGTWHFRLKDRSGKEFEGTLPVAEVVGFLQVVDAHRRGD